jgi:AAA+ superfamily predicted ATPase
MWKDQLLDVVLITWSERCYPSRHHWIVADTVALCDQFYAEVCEWSAEIRGEVLVFQDGEWIKSRELLEAIKGVTFDNLILHGSLKDDIQSDLARFFAARETYERYRVPWKRGVLFTGPPGNGKTHTVKALINQLKKSCLYVKGFKTEYATDQENIAQIFARARMTTPCLLVFEDLDSMLDDASRSVFLNELDGFETNAGIVVIATTNHPERLDAAIVDRPSRFDRKYHFELPGEEERRAYIGAWNKELELDLRVCESRITEVVQVTDGFSFAYMKELFLSSMMQWMGNGKSSMGDVIIDQAGRLRAQMEKTPR